MLQTKLSLSLSRALVFFHGPSEQCRLRSDQRRASTSVPSLAPALPRRARLFASEERAPGVYFGTFCDRFAPQQRSGRTQHHRSAHRGWASSADPNRRPRAAPRLPPRGARRPPTRRGPRPRLCWSRPRRHRSWCLEELVQIPMRGVARVGQAAWPHRPLIAAHRSLLARQRLQGRKRLLSPVLLRRPQQPSVSHRPSSPCARAPTAAMA